MPRLPKTSYHSVPHQAKHLDKVKKDDRSEIIAAGLNLSVHKGVYGTAPDSELMAESVMIGNNQNFLEIGCGTGVISLAVAKRARSGVGVDVNELAVANSKENAEKLGIRNVNFLRSNVFQNVEGTYDVIICNPPYTNHAIRDDIDRMFWDPGDEMKTTFFGEVGTYLKSGGRIYFGWANFADINTELPFELAEKNNYRHTNTFVRSAENGKFAFYVFEFVLQ